MLMAASRQWPTPLGTVRSRRQGRPDRTVPVPAASKEIANEHREPDHRPSRRRRRLRLDGRAGLPRDARPADHARHRARSADQRASPGPRARHRSHARAGEPEEARARPSRRLLPSPGNLRHAGRHHRPGHGVGDARGARTTRGPTRGHIGPPREPGRPLGQGRPDRRDGSRHSGQPCVDGVRHRRAPAHLRRDRQRAPRRDSGASRQPRHPHLVPRARPVTHHRRPRARACRSAARHRRGAADRAAELALAHTTHFEKSVREVL